MYPIKRTINVQLARPTAAFYKTVLRFNLRWKTCTVHDKVSAIEPLKACNFYQIKWRIFRLAILL